MQKRVQNRCLGSSFWASMQSKLFSRLRHESCQTVSELFQKHQVHPMQYDEKYLKEGCCCKYCCCCCRSCYREEENNCSPEKKQKKRHKQRIDKEQTETQVTFINERRAVSADGKLSEKEKRREKKRLEAKQIAADKRLMAKGLSGFQPPPREGTFDVKFTSGKATGHILLRIGVDLMEIDDDSRSRFTGKPEDSLEVGHNVKVKYIAEGRKVKNLTGRFLPAQIIKVNVDRVDPDAFGPKAVEYSAAKLRQLRQKYELAKHEQIVVESIEDDVIGLDV